MRPTVSLTLQCMYMLVYVMSTGTTKAMTTVVDVTATFAPELGSCLHCSVCNIILTIRCYWSADDLTCCHDSSTFAADDGKCVVSCCRRQVGADNNSLCGCGQCGSRCYHSSCSPRRCIKTASSCPLVHKVLHTTLLYYTIYIVQQQLYSNIYISCVCYDVSVRLSVRLSVMEVHWRIIANLGFKFRSHFTAYCGRRAACGWFISHHASQC